MALRSGRVGIHPSQVDPITGMLLNGPTPGSVSFEDLSDAQITDPEAGQTLQYNGTGWENVFASISPVTPATLASLQDVMLSDLQDGDFISYDATEEKWVNVGEAPAPTYTDITVTMYGAVEDTISFTDAAGISHSEVFASGQSSKSVTFKINPLGSTSITFTSAVAKNPEDLTADYSKTVTITDATTEIKVMPDNCLYWFGWKDSSLQNCDNTFDNMFTGGQGFTADAPTYNINSITLAPSADDKLTGVYVGNVPSGSTPKIISQATSSIDAYYPFTKIATAISQAGTTQTEFFTTTYQVQTMNTVSADSYFAVGTAKRRNGNLYAMWYE